MLSKTRRTGLLGKTRTPATLCASAAYTGRVPLKEPRQKVDRVPWPRAPQRWTRSRCRTASHWPPRAARSPRSAFSTASRRRAHSRTASRCGRGVRTRVVIASFTRVPQDAAAGARGLAACASQLAAYRKVRAFPARRLLTARPLAVSGLARTRAATAGDLPRARSVPARRRRVRRPRGEVSRVTCCMEWP